LYPIPDLRNGFAAKDFYGVYLKQVAPFEQRNMNLIAREVEIGLVLPVDDVFHKAMYLFAEEINKADVETASQIWRTLKKMQGWRYDNVTTSALR